MRLAVLFSGGKDSTYAAALMAQQGHELYRLVSIVPDDLDSWLFHTPNLHLLPSLAAAIGVPLVTERSESNESCELEALRRALEGLDVDGVVAGAIASDFQWDRYNGVCEGLGLKVFSPLWRKEQLALLRDMADAGMRSIIVRVSAEGLDASWLGRELDARAIEELDVLSRSKGINPSGEGGEYETLALDSPIHAYPLRIVESEKTVTRDGGRLLIEKVSKGAKRVK